ncbi:hypothetical protein SMICM17S_00056 [Streptomyces microflavus]
MTTEQSPQRADGWTAAVRQRLGLGRLLPLGGAVEGAWIAETAAASVLRGASVPGAVLGTLRIGPATAAVDTAARAEPAGAAGADPAVPPAPPSALPPGPLRIEAEFRAAGDRPLPDAAAALRAALVTAAAARLGLEVAEVDLRVTALLDDGAPDQGDGPALRLPLGPGGEGGGAGGGGRRRGAGCRLADPGAGQWRRTPPRTTSGSRWRRPRHDRALDVARSVRTAVSAATADRLPVAVLVTDVVEAPGEARSGEGLSFGSGRIKGAGSGACSCKAEEGVTAEHWRPTTGTGHVRAGAREPGMIRTRGPRACRMSRPRRSGSAGQAGREALVGDARQAAKGATAPREAAVGESAAATNGEDMLRR